MTRLAAFRHENETRPESENPVVTLPATSAGLAPLLIGIGELAKLTSRSVPSLHRDDAAGRLPAALRIGGSKRWRYADIAEWVELGCPLRAEFEARRRNRR
jgi:predicted DNA-binding transcriptional regulator AlpA